MPRFAVYTAPTGALFVLVGAPQSGGLDPRQAAGVLDFGHRGDEKWVPHGTFFLVPQIPVAGAPARFAAAVFVAPLSSFREPSVADGIILRP